MHYVVEINVAQEADRRDIWVPICKEEGAVYRFTTAGEAETFRQERLRQQPRLKTRITPKDDVTAHKVVYVG